MMRDDLTGLLQNAAAGDSRAADVLLPVIYDELRALAAAFLRRENPGHTLQTTALVHEAYIKLVRQDGATLQNRAHFFALASQAMRRILVNHARDRGRHKRGGGLRRVPLDESAIISAESEVDLAALDEALNRLAAVDGRKARLVEMRFFGGLSVEDTAEVLGIAPATVKRDWVFARTWLYRELSSVDEGDGQQVGEG